MCSEREVSFSRSQIVLNHLFCWNEWQKDNDHQKICLEKWHCNPNHGDLKYTQIATGQNATISWTGQLRIKDFVSNVMSLYECYGH